MAAVCPDPIGSDVAPKVRPATGAQGEDMPEEHELIPGICLAALGAPERLLIGAMRLVGNGRRACPVMRGAFETQLGCQAGVGLNGLVTLAACLPLESGRKLTLGWLCVRGLTWD